jgi:acyl-CoA thioester hydrolase
VQHRKEIEIRWNDTDGFGHVNNAVYLTYLEEVRDEWLATALGDGGEVEDFVVARVAIDYRRELTQDDDRVIASCRLLRVGNSSFATSEEIRTLAGELAAVAETVMVARDASRRGSRPLRPAERDGLRSYGGDHSRA